MRLDPRAALVAALIAPAACAGPPIVTPVEDEPICPNFTVGSTQTEMSGGLKRPIYVEVLDDGDVVAKITLFGRTSDTAKKTPFLGTDEDNELDVHWRQCEHEHAPSPISDVKVKHVIKYECGQGDFYASDTLVTQEGQVDTLTLHVPLPPDPRCWGDDGETPDASGSAPPPDAKAAEPAPPDPTTSAEPAASSAPAASASESAAPPAPPPPKSQPPAAPKAPPAAPAPTAPPAPAPPPAP